MNPVGENNHPHLGLAVLLAMSMALGPLAIDAYLPAFPAIAADLRVTIHDISLSISFYVFVLAAGQLIGGPLSDRFGRGVVMLSGLGIFALASGLITRADSLADLLLWRSVQGFGGGWIAVCVPAIVRDHLSGREAARFFSLIGLMMILAPGIAPGIGSAILLHSGWTAIFVMLLCYAMVLGIMLRLVVFTTPGKPPAGHVAVPVWNRYRSVVRTRPALRFMFLQTLSFSVMLLFITHASFIYQQNFGASPTAFAVLFGANIVVMMVAVLVNRWLLNRTRARDILRWSVTLQAAGILLLVLVMLINPKLWLFLPAMMITVGTMGAITPNTQACYMDFFPQHGGTASALLGATQFSIGGLISAGSALLPETVLAVVLAMAGCSLVSLLLIWWRFGVSVNTRP